MSAPLCDPLLSEHGIPHGFGLRDSAAPEGLARPRQVHGTAVHVVREPGDAGGVEADAIVCGLPGIPIGVATADCVPVLLAGEGAAAVAAVHAGWRGLCAGVVAACVRSLPAAPLAAAIGPYVGPCCYEVDEPVLQAVRRRFGADPPPGAVRPGRPGHAWLDLGILVAAELAAAGLASAAVSRATAACTACDSERFHSYRRDGPRSGRLVHFVSALEARP